MSGDKIKSGHDHPFWMMNNNFVDDGHLENMGAFAITVYLVLMRYSNSSSRQCFPSYSTLQAKTGFSRPTIAKTIEQLIEKGYIRRLNHGDSRHNSSTYELLDLSLVPQPKVEVQLVKEINQLTPLTSKGDLPQLVKEINHTSKGDLPQLVKEINSNYTKVNKQIENTNFNNTNEKNADQTFEVFREVWNRDRPKHWSECRTFNDARISALKKFTKQYGDRSIGIFQNALFYAQNDKWCQKPETVLTINNFLSNSKPFEWSEKYDSRQNNPASCGNTPEDYLSAIAHL